MHVTLDSAAQGTSGGADRDPPPFYGDLTRLQTARHSRVVRIATLGPAGTSSQEAAGYLLRGLVGPAVTSEISLHDSFEKAADEVKRGAASAVVVANAYACVNVLYMDDMLDLAVVFIQMTPPYGMAARPDCPLPSTVRVASHPAPMPLLPGLLPPIFHLGGVIPASSTSHAADLVRTGEADLALTNATSVREQGLRFVSNTRPIKMLWSVFVRKDNEAVGDRTADEVGA